jgi:ribosomal-protein-alanine N-acetyltransferase
VRASNVAAIALYESLGFNEATIRRNYYPTPTDVKTPLLWLCQSVCKTR